MIDTIDYAWIGVWRAESELREEVQNIRLYCKRGPLVVGECYEGALDGEGVREWFIFDCGTGEVRKFAERSAYLEAVEGLGFEDEPGLLTVQENWDRYWGDMQ